MAYELYWISGSPYAWKTLLALEIKGVEYESKIVQASTQEHKEPWFLEMNPRGKVPVLKVGDKCLYETHSILAYLEAEHPSPPLHGTSLEETTLTWRLVSEVDAYLAPAVVDLVRPILFAGAEEITEEIREAAEAIHSELKGFEKTLIDGGAAMLAGEAVSAADIALYPFLMLVLRAAEKIKTEEDSLGFLPFDQTYPALAAWTRQVEALPGYEKTYPPHWG